MSERYSDGVLDEKFVSVENKLEVHFDAQNEMLSRIEKQTIKTNGSVAALTIWKEQMIGAMKAGAPLLGIIAASLGWITIDYLNHRDKVPSAEIQAAVSSGIQQGLEEAIKKYGN